MKPDADNLSIVDLIGRRLRDDIINGHLASGEQLVEVDLAQKYQASRNSIREVLHLLVREGLATSIRHRGVFVRTFCVGDLHDIYTARRTIQLQAVRSGLPYSDTRLEVMAATIKQARRAIEQRHWRDVGTYSLAFHQHLVSVLGSRLIDEFFLNICAQMRLIFSVSPDESIVQRPKWVEWEARMHGLLAGSNHAAAEKELAAYLDDSEVALSDVVRRYQTRP
jgi:DNA-binding GntR family transcriptional regulator